MFLIESKNEQIPCLLNPESLLMQRQAGVKTRSLHGGLVTGSNLTDDPLLFTGGGTTLLTVNLLFDINLSNSGTQIEYRDVRRLTKPLWLLTENYASDEGRWHPESVRFIWGKAFNFLGVITDIAERLEHFTADGIPQRSFLRLRMRRVTESRDDMSGGAKLPLELPDDFSGEIPELKSTTLTHAVSGAVTDAFSETGEAERLEQMAYKYYGDPALWRLLAWVNNINDPLQLDVGSVLQIPAQDDVRK